MREPERGAVNVFLKKRKVSHPSVRGEPEKQPWGILGKEKGELCVRRGFPQRGKALWDRKKNEILPRREGEGGKRRIKKLTGKKLEFAAKRKEQVQRCTQKKERETCGGREGKGDLIHGIEERGKNALEFVRIKRGGKRTTREKKTLLLKGTFLHNQKRWRKLGKKGEQFKKKGKREKESDLQAHRRF